jgi:muramidase (phage lysozyme)
MNQNLKAFLDMIAWAEIGPEMLAESNNGYNVLVGSLPGNMKLFHDYSDHPRVLVKINDKLKSTAAGRYQILRYIYDHYSKKLKLTGFYPDDQDAIAVELIRERGSLQRIIDGDVLAGISSVRKIWASMPGAGYGQGEKKVSDLISAYREAGGIVT